MVTARGFVVLALVTVWALRLAIHIFLRNAGKPEDFRYAAWRRQHGDRWPLISLFMVFLLQGSILWIVALPLQLVLAARDTVAVTLWDYPGILLWIAGFVFQALGDAQLARFKRDPANAGRIMDRGLWRWTRHPNYFGEALMWWGIWLLVAGLPGGVWTMIGPVLITWLLVKVSGMAMLERALGERPGYSEYCMRTSPFIPWFPRSVTRR
jgi:steroid 5-alpha reductase family enzyme